MFNLSKISQMGCISALALGLLAGCGAENEGETSKLRIIGGTVPSDGGLIESSTVALVSSSGQVFCTGTLIGARSVISAGHCLSGYGGTLYIAFGRNSSEFQYITASSYRVHPNYTGSFNQSVPSDVSSITLSQSAPSGYSPVSIVSQPSSGTVYLAGFGQTASGSSGQLYYKAVSVQANYGDEFQVSNGACYGDSGGPAYVYDGSSLSVAGATSRGASGCSGSAIYSSTYYFRNWF